MNYSKAITRYSTTLSFSVLLLVLILSSVSADDEYPWPEEYTILCASEERTGFNWRNGDWKPVRFKNEKRLIVKSNKNQCGTPSRGDLHIEEWDTHTKWVCLNERQFGDEYNPIFSSYCEEHYDGPNPKLFGPRTPKTWIYCDAPKMYLQPNGRYHYAHVHGHFEDVPVYGSPDSQFIEVGKCSMIKP